MEAVGEGPRLSPFTSSPTRKRVWPRIALGVVLCLTLIFSASVVPEALAHRSGCHRWHSCPSDRGTYVCGDLGRCSQCPDNQYCLNQKPRRDKREAISPQPYAPQAPSKAPSAPSDSGAY